MAVNTTHPDYDEAAVDWSRARDVLAGEDAVKAGGENYLPRLDSQTDEEFAAYVKRASFFNATARTSEAYQGLIFRRPPFVKLPEGGAGPATAGLRDDDPQGARAHSGFCLSGHPGGAGAGAGVCGGVAGAHASRTAFQGLVQRGVGE